LSYERSAIGKCSPRGGERHQRLPPPRPRFSRPRAPSRRSGCRGRAPRWRSPVGRATARNR